MSNKPKPCSKVKNACKYCLEQVTNKNGLQCQGACKKWAHYKCLNYTPGKISDIKAGVIKVMCPCPDCETNQEKEFLTNPPYSCSNHKCPANAKGPIKCDSDECPTNRRKSDDAMQCSTKACPEDLAQHPQIKKPRSGSPCFRTCKYPSIPKAMKQAKITSSGTCQNSKCKNASSSLNESEPKSRAAIDCALQEMCGTVGKLSIQIRDLMGKIDKLT